MADASMASVEPTSVLAVEPLHPARERLGRQSQQEVKVIGHQDIREKDPVEAMNRFPKQFEKDAPIDVVAKDVAPLVPTRRDMKQGTGKLESKLS